MKANDLLVRRTARAVPVNGGPRKKSRSRILMKPTLSYLHGKELPPFTGLLLLAAHVTVAAEDPLPCWDDNAHKQAIGDFLSGVRKRLRPSSSMRSGQ